MALAIFDLDNTLLGGDSDHAWGEFLIAEGIVDASLMKQKNDEFYAQYVDGNLDIFAYQQFVLSFIKDKPQELVNSWHQKFMETAIEKIVLPKGLNLLNKHREQGDYLLIITATNDFVTGPIASRLEVDDLIATQAEKINGVYTGEVIGVPSFQDGKVVRLEEWLGHNNQSMEGAWFYSDSHNDLPLLCEVENPVAVDPDEKLRSYAEEKDWSIISLRD